MPTQRREFIKSTGGTGLFMWLAAAGLIKPRELRAEPWNKAAFDATTLPELMRALNGDEPASGADIAIDAPEIAENGAVVPVTVSASLPGVSMIAILIEKNPNLLAASFTIPEGTLADVQTRVKMAQTSNVYALVKTGGKFVYAVKEIKITLGGCGG
ncbi:MAG: thiosulfate oxidation carrier protein SoxY [Burkholderiales bacterium]